MRSEEWGVSVECGLFRLSPLHTASNSLVPSSTRSVAPGDTIREELGVAVVGPGMLEVSGVCLKWVQDGGGFPVSHEVECPAVLIDVHDRAK